MSLSRSSMALQFCVQELLERSYEPCGFYLITIEELAPWPEIGMNHRYMLKLMGQDAKRGKIPRFGGVRVFEEGEKTERPHAHWVMTPRMPQKLVQRYASMAGMGHVWLDERPATKRLGMYLAKYLSKNRRALAGVRRWSCFGEFSSVKVHDVEVTSPEIETFRGYMKECKAEGLTGQDAYREAVVRSNIAKYAVANAAFKPTDDFGLEINGMAIAKASQSNRKYAEWKGKVDVTTVMKNGEITKLKQN